MSAGTGWRGVSTGGEDISSSSEVLPITHRIAFAGALNTWRPREVLTQLVHGAGRVCVPVLWRVGGEWEENGKGRDLRCTFGRLITFQASKPFFQIDMIEALRAGQLICFQSLYAGLFHHLLICNMH